MASLTLYVLTHIIGYIGKHTHTYKSNFNIIHSHTHFPFTMHTPISPLTPSLDFLVIFPLPSPFTFVVYVDVDLITMFAPLGRCVYVYVYVYATVPLVCCMLLCTCPSNRIPQSLQFAASTVESVWASVSAASSASGFRLWLLAFGLFLFLDLVLYVYGSIPNWVRVAAAFV